MRLKKKQLALEMEKAEDPENRGRQPERRRAYIHRGNTGGSSGNKNHPTNHNSKELPKVIGGPLTLEQLSIYQYIFRIREISSKLKQPNLEIPQTRNRSPSPPPVYDSEGKRTNTREQIYKKKLLNERFKLIEVVSKFMPGYTPPDDYKRPTTFQEKYYIPVSQYPEINFVGLLLGPRGKTLRMLQEESGCKIAIRGKGSVKEGKTSSDLPPGAMDFSDPLHCLVIADAEEKIEKAIKACRNIVIKAVTSPEGQNDLKRGQLRELAELNGTLREANRPCPVCGQQGHRKFECPHRETFAKRIVCSRCKQPGHATRDCTLTDEELSRQSRSRFNNPTSYDQYHSQPPSYTNRYNQDNGSRQFAPQNKDNQIPVGYYHNNNKRSQVEADLQEQQFTTKKSRYGDSLTNANINLNNGSSSLPVSSTVEGETYGSTINVPAGMSVNSSTPDISGSMQETELTKPPSSLDDLEGPPGFDIDVEEDKDSIVLEGPPGMS